MGSRGPRKTPTAILQMNGSWRAKNRPDAKEQAELPPAPTWLKGRTLEVWNELAPMLANKGVLTLRDANALARYCQTWVRWREAEEFLDKAGMSFSIVRDKKGEPVGTKSHASARLSLALQTILEKLEADFGMNPAARADILTPKEKPAMPTRDRTG